MANNARPLACIILSVLTVIAGIILLVTSSVFVNRLTSLRHFWELLFALSIVSIVIASLAIIFGIGLLYVVKRRFPALTTLFSGLLIAVAVLAAICVIILIVDRFRLRPRAVGNTRHLLATYYNSSDSARSQRVFDEIQRKYQCCGVDDAVDWKNRFHPNGTSTPDSCCMQQTTGCGINSLILQDKIFLRGCAEPMYAETRKRYTTLIGMNFNLLILALITAVLGMVFERSIRDQYQAM